MLPGHWTVMAVLVLGAVLAFSSTAAPASGASVAPSPAPSVHPEATPYWTDLNLSPAHQPKSQIDGNFVWDSTDGYGLLFGGENESSSTFHYYNFTWTFLHGAWTNVTPTVAPSERVGASMSDDPLDGEVILFGGESFFSTPSPHSVRLNDTWAWKAGTWTNITPIHSPPASFWSSMTYDAATDSVILFGGNNQTSDYGNDTWSFSGGVWTQLFPHTLPPGRDGQQMVYDAASSEVVMFGGNGAVETLNDTWTFADDTWSPIAAGNHPDARTATGLAYDTATGQVELYGGTPAPFDYYATWFFSDGAWTETNLTNPPPNPTNPWEQMTFDPTDNYTVLFYSPDAAPPAATWTLTVPPGAPPPPPPPGRLYVLLDAAPSAINLTHSTTFTTVVVPSNASDRFVYSTVPQGCTGQNSSTFSCTPTEVGHFVVGVNVTAPNGSHGEAVTTLDVTQNTTVPPPGSSPNNTNLGSLWWIVVVVVVVLATVLFFAALRRRRKAPPPPPSFSPPPPPSPPPATPPT
ncbi:MAG TPA: hypothetical protein VMF04_03100 [Thermoplasmata archaeon]|nr:hypothetical protein [Thermoplasmata archaeon]